jgi:hypothetical protein
VKTAIVKPDEITLELLARTTIGMIGPGSEKYAGVHQYEMMIPKAYQFLRSCKNELENKLENEPARIARYNALHSEGTEGPANWTDIRNVTHRDDKKIIKFFEQNPDWRRLFHEDYETRVRYQTKRDAMENQIRKEMSTIDPLERDERGVLLIDIAVGKLSQFLNCPGIVEWSAEKTHADS